MSNWSNNTGDYKIDTWDPNSVKAPSNAAGIRPTTQNSSQHPSYYQTPTAPRYESRSNAPEYNMNDYKRHIDMPSSAQYSSPLHHVSTAASQPAFLQQQSNRPQQQQLPEPTFFQKQQVPQHQTPDLELLQTQQLLQQQQQQSLHLKLMQQRQVMQKQQQSPHLELLQQQQQSHHLKLLQQRQPQQQQSPHLELLQQQQPQRLARPYSDTSNQSSNYQLSQSGATFQSPNNSMSYNSGYMSQTPKLASASNSFDNGSQNYRPAVLSTPKCNRFEPEEIDPKSIFVNPLIDGPEDFQTAKEEELKIQNMKAANEKDQEFAYRRPTSIAKASLAQISLDLQKAGEPFRSATSLKNFKNNALGLPPTEDSQLLCQEQNDSLSVALSEVSLSKTSKLSADAKEFTPSYVVKSASLLQRKPAERVMKETLDNINLRPYLFDDQVPKLQKTLKTYDLNAETVKPLTTLLFEACLAEKNLIHHGSKICDLFSRSDGGFEGFRNGILSLAQKEFSSLDELLAGGDGPVGQERVQNFTKFMSELYLNMKDESSHRFNFLGNKVVDAVEKLQQVPLTEANILAIVQVLKLTVKPLRQQFDLHSEDYKNRLEAVIKKVYSYKEDCQPKAVAIVNSFINFMERKPEAPKPMPQSSASHDHSLSEVVFFTPEGKAYTEQDVIAEKMLGICSSITENYDYQLEIEHQQRANAMYNSNNCADQDDYDDDYEKFMQGLDQ